MLTVTDPVKTDFFKLFFEEKSIPFTEWEILDAEGIVHFIDSDVVIEQIHSAPKSEKKSIEKILRRLDFRNEPIVPFIRHLAGCLVGESPS